MKAFQTKPVASGEPIVFPLDGVEYTFTPPKTSVGIVNMIQVHGDGPDANLARAGILMTWLGQGLDRAHEPRKGKKPKPGHTDYVEGCQACALQDRLEDPDDDLQIDTVLDIVNELIAEVAARPTM